MTVPPSRSGGSSGGARRSVLPASLPSLAARSLILALLLAADGLGGHGLAVGGDPVGAAGGRGQRPERGGVGLGALAAGQIDPTQVIYGRVLDVRWPGASERGLPPVGRGSP